MKNIFRHLVFVTLMLASEYSSGQLKSDKTYFFNEEIDSLLVELRGAMYKRAVVIMKNNSEIGYYAQEKIEYERVNDSLLDVKHNNKNQRYKYKEGFYQLVDSQPKRVEDGVNYNLKKDSSGYIVTYVYFINHKDTNLTYYSRLKYDNEGRVTNYFFSNGQHLKNQETNYFKSRDTILIKQNSALYNVQGDYLSFDTTITKIYYRGSKKIVERYYKQKNNTSFTTPFAFFKSFSRKTILYSRKKIRTVDYIESKSTGKKEKASMEIKYY